MPNPDSDDSTSNPDGVHANNHQTSRADSISNGCTSNPDGVHTNNHQTSPADSDSIVASTSSPLAIYTGPVGPTSNPVNLKEMVLRYLKEKGMGKDLVEDICKDLSIDIIEVNESGVGDPNKKDSDRSSSSSETLETQKVWRKIPIKMFLESLLEELCAYYAKDNVQQRILFKIISGYLSKAKDKFQQVRMAIRKFIDTAVTASQADPQEIYLSLSATGVGEQILKAFLDNDGPVFFPPFLNPNLKKQMPQAMSRYKKDFVELERIGEGGGGSVYRVRSILDNQEYAIKKIELKGTDKEFYEKVIREVELLASMHHPNIVRYNTAWIDHQASQTSPRNNLPAIEYPVYQVFSRQESSSSDDIENDGYNPPHSPGVASNIIQTSCIIEDVTDDSEGINGVNDNPGYAHSHATISSKQCTSVSNSESFNLTRKEKDISIDFNASYTGNYMRSYTEHKSKVTTSTVTTEEIISSKETEGIKMCGDFGSFDPLRSKKEDYHEQKSKVILYIQMELYNRTLFDWLEERNARDPIQGRDYFSIVDDSVNQAVFKQMVEGISYIHQKNVLHRDLKPTNIFLAGTEKEFRVCIGDFGLAREHRAEKQQDPVTPLETLKYQLRGVVIPPCKLTTEIGTSTYASPEQRNGNNYDHKSDMYSLGMIYFEMYHPFKTKTERCKCLTALRAGTVPDEIQTRWPDEFTIIKQLTSENPEKRPSAENLKKGKLFMPNDELIKSLKKEIMENNQQLKEKDDVIKSLRSELNKFRALQRS